MLGPQNVETRPAEVQETKLRKDMNAALLVDGIQQNDDKPLGNEVSQQCCSTDANPVWATKHSPKSRQNRC